MSAGEDYNSSLYSWGSEWPPELLLTQILYKYMQKSKTPNSFAMLMANEITHFDHKLSDHLSILPATPKPLSLSLENAVAGWHLRHKLAIEVFVDNDRP